MVDISLKTGYPTVTIPMIGNKFCTENHTLYLQNIMQQRFYGKMIGAWANWF